MTGAFLNRFVNRPAALTTVIGAGLIVRIIFSLGSSAVLWPDSLVYYGTALNFLEDGNLAGHRIYHTPLYPLFLGLFLRWGRSAAVGALILAAQRCLGLGATYFVYRTAGRLFNPWVAFFSGLLFTLNPLQLYYETVIQTEVLFVFFFTALLASLASAFNNPRPRLFALVGLCAAMLTLTRPVAQAAVFLILTFIWPLSGDRKKALMASAAMLATYFCLMLPWQYVNYLAHGFFGVSRGQGLNLFMRVFDVDKLDPPADTDFPKVKRALIGARGQLTGKGVYYDVYTKLQRRYRLTSAEADRRMLGFAWETAGAHLGRYAGNTVKQFFLTLARPRNSVRVCGPPRGPYLCTGKKHLLSLPPFADPRRAGFPSMRRFIAGYVHFLKAPMTLFLPFLAVGSLAVLAGGNAGRTALLMLGVYLLAVAALFNFHEDRFRLPVDPIIFMLTAWGATVMPAALKAIPKYAPKLILCKGRHDPKNR